MVRRVLRRAPVTQRRADQIVRYGITIVYTAEFVPPFVVPVFCQLQMRPIVKLSRLEAAMIAVWLCVAMPLWFVNVTDTGGTGRNQFVELSLGRFVLNSKNGRSTVASFVTVLPTHTTETGRSRKITNGLEVELVVM